MSRQLAELRLEERSTLLEFEDSRTVTLRVAPQGLAETVPQHELPHGREIAAALVILRGSMHHLGVGRVDMLPA